MKESNTLANIAAMKQLERNIFNHTRRQCTKESNTLVEYVVIKLLGRLVLSNI